MIGRIIIAVLLLGAGVFVGVTMAGGDPVAIVSDGAGSIGIETNPPHTNVSIGQANAGESWPNAVDKVVFYESGAVEIYESADTDCYTRVSVGHAASMPDSPAHGWGVGADNPHVFDLKGHIEGNGPYEDRTFTVNVGEKDRCISTQRLELDFTPPAQYFENATG